VPVPIHKIAADVQAVLEIGATPMMTFGKLAVLPVRMNPDLAMGDELLKKTGSGNLFKIGTGTARNFQGIEFRLTKAC